MKLRTGFLSIVITIVMLTTLALTTSVHAAGTCYVNDDASGASDGTSWTDAYTDLQSALADPCTEIWVASGTYKPDASDRTVSFTLESGTAIYGGFDGTETMLNQRNPVANVTTLSGDLNGDDSGFTNNGENSYHVVYANNVDNTAMLDGFTIRGGNANGSGTDNQGGGIYTTNSDATLANLILRNNAGGYGGGMHAGAFTTSTLANVTFKDNASSAAGGGLYMTVATVSLLGVTFSNNTSYAGGGMFIANQLPTLTNVTFSSNSADLGGGLYLYGTAPTLTNVTFSGNSAAVAAGGLYVDYVSSPILTNVIIADSTNGDCVVNSGSIDGASSNNLIEDTASNACDLTDGISGNIIGTDPALGALADNGGATLTFLPEVGSAAIDAGTNSGCSATDQRGLSRPQNGTCDIGAVEHDITPPTVTDFTASSSVTSLDVPINTFTASDNLPASLTGYKITESATPPSAGDAGWTSSAPTSFTVAGTGNRTLYPWAKDAGGNVSSVYGSPASVSVCFVNLIVTSNADSGAGTLRQAIADACAGTTITFDSGLSGSTIYLASTLSLTKDVTIDGSSLASHITLSGDSDQDTDGDVQVFSINSGLNIALDNLTITKGRAYGTNPNDPNDPTGQGGAIHAQSPLTITNSTFTDNSSTGNGGAIYSNAPLTIIDSTFSGNSITTAISGYGGAVSSDGLATVINSTFYNNSNNNGFAGALFASSTGSSITNSTFTGNTALTGGAVLGNGDQFTITNTTISGNNADVYGGLAMTGPSATLSNTIIANSTGGDCYSDVGTALTATNNIVEDDSCSATLSVDPNIGPLADNGGPTQTMALTASSPAIDAGDDAICAAYPVSNYDQRGMTRPNSLHCDIGAYEYIDATVPGVTAFTVATTYLTNLNIPITAFTASDNLTVAGYKITTSSTPPSAGAAGWTTSAPTTYTVSSDGSYTLYPWAKDAAGNISAVYGSPVLVTVVSTLNVKSAGSQDGWVLESSETSNKGGTLNSSATTFRLGDEAAKKQYRGILSFNTSSLPDANIVITNVTLKVKKQGITGGGNPLTTFQGFMVDIKKGLLGTSALQAADFQTTGNKTYGPFTPTLSGGWYTINLTSGKAYINRLTTNGGLTQIRLRFKLDDNNNTIANYLSLFSGNAPAASRPQLIVEYYVP